jgi:hypothetical protein
MDCPGATTAGCSGTKQHCGSAAGHEDLQASCEDPRRPWSLATFAGDGQPQEQEFARASLRQRAAHRVDLTAEGGRHCVSCQRILTQIVGVRGELSPSRPTAIGSIFGDRKLKAASINMTVALGLRLLQKYRS